MSDEHRRKLSKAMKKKWGNKNHRQRMLSIFQKDTPDEKLARFKRHEQLVASELKRLQEQGFRCILTTQSATKPDIIAIEGQCKIYAVEVTKTDYPRYHKYDDIPKIFDDVIWVVRRAK